MQVNNIWLQPGKVKSKSVCINYSFISQYTHVENLSGLPANLSSLNIIFEPNMAERKIAYTTPSAIKIVSSTNSSLS